MRILVLACVVALGTSSFDWHASSASITDPAAPKAAAKAVLSQSTEPCAFALEDASIDAQNELFSEVSGVWRDSLGDAVESDTSGLRTQEGFRFGRKSAAFSLEIGRAVVQISPSDSSNDDLETKGFDGALTSENVRIGQTSSDGFTAVQARFHIAKDQPQSCVTLALKIMQMGDGRRTLLVRGPLSQSSSADVKPMSAFFFMVRDTTRMFTH